MSKPVIIFPDNGYITELNSIICQIGIQRAITEDFVALAVRAAIAKYGDDEHYIATAISYFNEVPCELTNTAISKFQTLVKYLRISFLNMFGSKSETITFSGFYGNTCNLLLTGG